VADPAVRADVHEPLDVHRGLGPERPLHLVRPLDLGAQARHVRVGEVTDALRGGDPRRLEDLLRRGAPDPKDVSKSDLDLFVAREIDAGDTCH
jgi:hypothetical protein